jgi:hypothetical protein
VLSMLANMPSFGGEVKPSVPCRRFAVCKRSLNEVEKALFHQNYRTPFSPTAPSFATRSGRGGIWHRKWERLKAGKAIANYP